MIERAKIENGILGLDLSKIIIFGDSFTEGYSPDGNVISWGNRLIPYLECEKSHVYGEGGVGFTHMSSSSRRTGIQAWNNHKGEISWLDEATTVFVMLGWNDNDQDYGDSFMDAVETFFNQVLSDCPNASVVYLFNPGLVPPKKQIIRKIYDAVMIYAKQKVVFWDSWSWMVFNESCFSSDNVHPNSSGQTTIARNVYRKLLGGDIETSAVCNISDVNGFTFNLERNGKMVNIYASGTVNAIRANAIGHFPGYFTPWKKSAGPVLRWSFPVMLGTGKIGLLDMGGSNGNSVYILQTDDYISDSFQITSSVDLLEFLG